MHIKLGSGPTKRRVTDRISFLSGFLLAFWFRPDSRITYWLAGPLVEPKHPKFAIEDDRGSSRRFSISMRHCTMRLIAFEERWIKNENVVTSWQPLLNSTWPNPLFKSKTLTVVLSKNYSISVGNFLSFPARISISRSRLNYEIKIRLYFPHFAYSKNSFLSSYDHRFTCRFWKGKTRCIPRGRE